MLIRGDVAFHDYEGVAVDLGERERLVADLGDKECDDPAQPRHARGRQERRRMLHPALLSRARVPGADHGACRPATTSTIRRRARPRPPRSRARSACRWPRICSPGRRSSARPTGSIRASRPDRFPSRKVFTCQSGKSGYDFPYWKVNGVAHGNCRTSCRRSTPNATPNCKWRRRQPVRRGVTRCSG